MTEVHARFSGSKADRWMNCPGSTALCATVPPLPSSSYAQEGTMAHTLAEYCLRNGYDNAVTATADMDLAGGAVVSREMCDAVQVYLDAVYEEMGSAADTELYVEQQFAFPGMEDEVFGRNDAIVYTPSRKRLVVFDYKHGVGVSVSADDNAQLKFYAAGAVLANPTWQVAEIILVIVQPRARDAEEAGAVKPWPMDVLEVIDFSAEIAVAVATAKDPPVGVDRLKPGSWCRWCDAAAICSARERQALDAMGVAFADVTMVDVTALDEPANLDVERISQVLKGIDTLNSWANQVREFVEAQMVHGNLTIPGWKVVQKIGRAKWIDSDADVAAYLDMMWNIPIDDSTPRKLATIGTVEKLLKSAGAKKDDIDDVKLRFTIKESSGVTIASISDRREAVSPAAQFDGVKVES